MPEYPALYLISPEKIRSGSYHFYGEFHHSENMYWGPWRLTSEPEKLGQSDDITVLECWAEEALDDENGVPAQGSLSYDPCRRHFLVGRNAEGKVLWWHNLGDYQYDLNRKKFCESSIQISGSEIKIKGYGCCHELYETISINIQTGERIL